MNYEFDINVDVSPLLDLDVGSVSPSFRVNAKDVPLKLGDLDNIDWDLVASSLLGITDPIGQLRDWLASVLSGLFDSIKKFFEGLVKPVSDLLNNVWNIVSRIPDAFNTILNALKSVVIDPISNLLKWISDNLSNLAGAISNAMNTIMQTIQGLPDIVANFVDKVSRTISDLVDKVASGFKWLLDQLSTIPDAIKNMLAGVAGAFTDLADKIKAGFAWFIDQVSKLPDTVKSLLDSIAGAVGGLLDKVKAGLSWFIDQVSKLPDVARDIAGKIASAVGDLLDKIKTGFSWFIEQISKLPETLRAISERIIGVLTDLAEKAGKGLTALLELIAKAPAVVKDALSSILGDVAKGVGGLVEWVRGGFEAIAKTMSSWFESARGWFTEATNALRQLGSIFTGFVNAILQLPDRLAYAFKGVVDFFNNLWAGLQSFIKDPAGWLGKYVITPLWSGLQWLGGKVWEGVQWLWSMIVKGAEWLWNTLKTAGEWLVNALRGVYDALHGFFAGVADAIGKAGEAIYGFFVNAFSRLVDTVKFAVESVVKPVISEFMKAVGWGSPPGLTIRNFAGAWVTSFEWSIPLYGFALAMEIPLRAIAFAMRGIAMAMRDLNWKIRLSLKPLGIGAETEFDVAKAIGAALYNFSEEIMKHVDKFYEPFWMGVGLWYGRYASMLLTYNLRNFLPIEMPTLRESEEMWNKIRATGLAKYGIPRVVLGTPKDAEEAILNFLKIRGYSDYVLKLAFADESEFYLEILDRFGAKRRIPLADAWRLPSPSDVITMMIRDVFPTVEDFVAVMRSVGFNKDTAVLYYYLHYRYPSPERLAEFYWRGMAGVLWYPYSLFEADQAKSLNLNVTAKSPRELNFDFNALNDMVSKYMKWHDFAPFPWINGFTTDKAIITELMARLPGRVEYRWMARWGVLEHLSKLGVGITTPIEDIIDAITSARGDEVFSKQVTPGITLDASLLSRFLVAAGMHPVFAAISSITESHTMLADEMTLLRTGFLELYRTGLADINVAEQLMSGLITVQFTTAYLDLAKGAWTTLTYNKPVLWLPAERRLAQLRSAIDRYYILWSNFVRELERGIRMLILLTRSDVSAIKDYIKQLKLPEGVTVRVQELLSELDKSTTSEDLLAQYYNIVSSMLSSEVKAITGRDIKFTIDQAYISTWLEYAELTRVIEARRWVRLFATRMMGWVFYRISYGWVQPDEYKALTTMLLARGWISIEEKEFLDTVADWVYRIAVKETAPTPSQLATFAEYIVLDESIVKKVLSHYNVPRDYWDLWERYIAVKPVKSDFKQLINVALRALRYGVLSKEEWKKILDKARSYGFTEVEISLIERRSELELAIESAREYVPTPTVLATLSEYLTLPASLIQQALKARRIPEEWVNIWLQYIAVKPVKSDFKQLINVALRALRYGVLSKEEWGKILSDAVEYGFTDVELSLIQRRADLELAIESAREYVPTPAQLATMAEYLPDVRKYVSQVLEARRVKGVWVELWMKYIYTRAIYSDVARWANSMFRLAEYLIIDVKQLDSVFKVLSTYGWESLEIDIATKTVLAEQVRIAFNYVVGSPRNLAGMARYTDKAADWAYSRASKLVDALPVDDATKKVLKEMWKEYITSYQANPEISRYVTELITSYAYGIIDDKGLDQELNYLRGLGVPELRLALIKRTAMLRRARRLATVRG
jgi:phage-related protein